MQLIIITPYNRLLDFVIEDWEAINEHAELTEVALTMLEPKEAKMLWHTLEYSSVRARMSSQTCVIVKKPNNLAYSNSGEKEYLKLDFSTKTT